MIKFRDNEKENGKDLVLLLRHRIVLVGVAQARARAQVLKVLKVQKVLRFLLVPQLIQRKNF